jgi:hypothetical protein
LNHKASPVIACAGKVSLIFHQIAERDIQLA